MLSHIIQQVQIVEWIFVYLLVAAFLLVNTRESTYKSLILFLKFFG